MDAFDDADDELMLAALAAAEAAVYRPPPAPPPPPPPRQEAPRSSGPTCVVCLQPLDASGGPCPLCGSLRLPCAPAGAAAALPAVVGGPQADQGRPAASAVSFPSAGSGALPRVQPSLRPDGKVSIRMVPGTCPALDALLQQQAGAHQEAPLVWTLSPSAYSALQLALRTPPSSSLARLDNSLNSPFVTSALDFLCRNQVSEEEVEMRWALCPEKQRTDMFGFQREGVRYALRHGGRALLGDEMGLGKTVQALALLACYPDDRPCLIVCPATLRDTWGEQVERWLPNEGSPAKVMDGKEPSCRNALRQAGSKGIIICPVSLLEKFTKNGAGSVNFRMVIADEAHQLKNRTAQRTMAAVPVLRAAARALCLSGTPAVNRPGELFTQLHMLLPSLFPDWYKYGTRYCEGGKFAFGTGSSNVPELHAILLSCCMVRRLKKDVLTQLPAKMRTRVTLSIQPTAAVSALFGALQARGPPPGGWTAAAAAGGRDEESRRLLNELYVKTSQMKAQPCAQYLSELFEGSDDAKVLFFAHHGCMLDAAAAQLTKDKVAFIRIDGSTPVNHRQALVNQFQNDPRTRCALLSITAAGVGLTLTASSTVVFGELVWSPGDVVQAEDRAHRIGQRNCVNINFLQVPGTIDEIMWSTIERKLDTLGQVLDGAKCGAGGMAASTAPSGAPVGREAAVACAPAAGTIAAMFAAAPKPEEPPRLALAPLEEAPVGAAGAEAAVDWNAKFSCEAEGWTEAQAVGAAEGRPAKQARVGGGDDAGWEGWG